VSSLAIVLRWRSYGESDKIVTLLTRDFGKLTGIAKGAKRSRRRFPGSLEVLARVRVQYRRRPEASLAFLESADLLAPMGELADPARFAYGGYLVELVDRLTVEEHVVPELYDLLAEALAALAEGPATSALLRAFELQLLVRAGYAPPLDTCGTCHDPLPRVDSVFLDPIRGVLRCFRCRGSGSVIEIGAEVIGRLAALRDVPIGECRELGFGAIADEAAQLTGRLIEQHLSRPLESPKLIAQLAVARS